MPQRTDDPTVADDEILWRRIIDPGWVTTEEDGTCRPSSGAFIDRRSEELSVNVASQTSVEQVMNGYEDGFALAGFPAGVPRSYGHVVAATPEEDDPDDPSHRVVVAKPETGLSQRKKAAKKMAEAARWVVPPKQMRED